MRKLLAATLGLSLDHFPINRGLYDLRFLGGQIDFRAEEDNSVHTAVRFLDGVNHCRRPFPLPNVTALLERSGNRLLSSITACEDKQPNN